MILNDAGMHLKSGVEELYGMDAMLATTFGLLFPYQYQRNLPRFCEVHFLSSSAGALCACFRGCVAGVNATKTGYAIHKT